MTSSDYGETVEERDILRLSQIFRGYFGGDDRDERVRRKLVETLYTQPTSLAANSDTPIGATQTLT